MLPLPGAALAHAIVVESVPARDARLPEAPTRVLLRFNSKIEAGLSRATIEPAGGARVPLSVSAGPDGAPFADRLVLPLKPLAPGTYVIRYRVLAADGHLTEGALRFTVGAAP